MEDEIREPEKNITEDDVNDINVDDRAEDGLNNNEDDSENLVNRIVSYITIALLAVSIVFVGYVMICTARGKVIKVFGKSVLKVVTGSMEPTILTGDYIIIEETQADKLQLNDIITFYSKDPGIEDKLVTHRIIKINEDGSFKTQGDANNISDTTDVTSDRIVGRYVKKSRFFRWIDSFGGRRKLLMLLVMIPILIISIFEVRSMAKLLKQAIEESRAAKEANDNCRTFENQESLDAEIERLKQEAIKEYLENKDKDEQED